jgi:hypothetical protein
VPTFSLLLLSLLGCGLETYNEDSAVGARFELIPDGELSFERVPANKASTAVLTVLSTGDERMVIDAVVLSGPQADRFVLPEELPLPIGLAPGTDFPINISFLPTAQGQFSALVEVTPRSGPVLSRRIVGQACEDQGGSNLCPP